jgi:uroporphyrinogen decarboxylase
MDLVWPGESERRYAMQQPVTPVLGCARERVLAALSHQSPERVPFSWGFGPTPEMAQVLREYLGEHGLDWDRLRAVTEDVLTIGAAYTQGAAPTREELFGIRFEPQSYGAGTYNEISFHPLAGVKDPAELEHFPWPDPGLYDDAGLRAQVLSVDPLAGRARKLGLETCGNPFEIYCWMTGLEEALCNVRLNRQLVHAALGRITDFFAARLRRTLDACGDLVDICYFADDLGGQAGLLMSRRSYREILQSYHARLFAIAGELAPQAAVMLHSDGAVFDVLPDLLDIGLDVLEAVQVDAAGMDPVRLKAAYGHKLAFYGGISVQALLPYGEASRVAAECSNLVEVFGEHGGYIAAPTHAIQVGTPPANVLAMLQAVLGEDDYEQACDAARQA